MTCPCLTGDDPDELEVYGGDGGDASHPSGPTLSSFSFEVLDTVLNIGPISELSIAQPAFLSVRGEKGVGREGGV